MTFQVTVQPSGHQFSCEADETVLAAAIRAGVGLPYGCKNGACGSCKGKVVSGSVQHKAHQQRALTPEEEAAGFSLFCCATASADLVIEAREVAGSSDYPIKKMPSRVTTIEKVAPDVVVLTLQLPASERLNYRAGQYIEFMLRDNKRRSYSMASAPVDGGPVTLHIRHIPGGLFTDQVFTTLKERDILRFEGPMGTFFLREDSDKPVVLLASGTGFAPLKAIVEHMINEGSTRPITLYWGGRARTTCTWMPCAASGPPTCRSSLTCPSSRTPCRKTRGAAARASCTRPSSPTCPTCPPTRCMPAARP